MQASLLAGRFSLLSALTQSSQLKVWQRSFFYYYEIVNLDVKCSFKMNINVQYSCKHN